MRIDQKEKFFTMRVPMDLHRTIKAHCVNTGMSMKDFSINALNHYLSVSCGDLHKVQDKLMQEDVK